MSELRYRVDFAHENDNAADESVHHGRGSVEITTDLPITTQAQKNEVARAIGLSMNKTKIAVMQIVPLNADDVLVDYSDVLSEDTKKMLNDSAQSDVYNITSLGGSE